MSEDVNTGCPTANAVEHHRGKPLEKEYPPIDVLMQVMKIVQACSHAANTIKNYTRFWKLFVEFCVHYGFEYLPAETDTVLLFLTFIGTYMKPDVVRIGKSAIAFHHNQARLFDPSAAPSVSAFISGLKRHHGQPRVQKRALTSPEVFGMCAILDLEGGVTAVRNRCAILVGFTGCLRISEVTGLNRQDVTVATHAKLVICRSKTDQEGNGKVRWLKKGNNPATCPVLALAEWLKVYDEKRPEAKPTDPLFPVLWRVGDPANLDMRIDPKRRMSQVVFRDLLKLLAPQVNANIKPEEIGGHSLRAGHATEATLNGAPRETVKEGGGWASDAVDSYIRAAKGPENSSSGYLGT